MAPVFVCPLCDKTLSKRFNLKRHMNDVHNNACDIPVATQNSISCNICNTNCKDFSRFETHLNSEHSITLKSEDLTFQSASEFVVWKSNLEEDENTCFVRNTSKKRLADGCYSEYYQCKRSGFFNPKTDRKRELKTQGSCKINGFCPSRIKAKFFQDGKVIAQYCSTHIGHKSDLAHKPLSLQERQNIASKIASQIPYDAILDEIRSSLNNENLHRIHLITKLDLYNIEAEFGLNYAVRHSNDTISVDAWVEKERMSDSNCVVIYKPQGEQHNMFSENDFALGIMTQAQQEIFKKYGSDCVCMDSTHGLNAYDFEMVTIMVIDDMRQGFPCGFFISNRTDKKSIETFLTEIKNKIGIIQPKVFMSDMADSLYSAWSSVMGHVEKRLYCTWHVDRAWQKNLNKIKEKEVQKEVYKKCRVLLEETDENAFLSMLPSIVSNLCETEATKEYGQYFKDNYQGCYKLWAYCFRLNAGINTNMHLESMHRTLKHLFLKGKTVKRLDKAIHAIMQMVKQKLFDRLTILEKGKITSKVKDLRKRHKLSLTMKDNLVINSGTLAWEVSSASSSSNVYTVRLIEPNCACSIVCTQCSSCIHKYSCSCIDSSVKWNMCKHIHLVCRQLQKDENTAHCEITSNPEEKDNQLVIDESNCEEKSLILKEIGKKEEAGDRNLEVEKSLLIQEFDSIVKQINTVEDIRLAKQSLKNLTAKLKVTKRDCTSQLKPKKRCNINKKIELQRRFFSTRKKKISNKKRKKPSMKEAQQITMEALLDVPCNETPNKA